LEQRGTRRLGLRRSQAHVFADIGRDRAEKANVDGLYVLISRDPAYDQVTVSPKSAEGLFSRYQQKQLEKLLDDRLQGVQAGVGRNTAAGAAVGLGWEQRQAAGADKALLAALDQVTTVLRERAGDPNAVRPGVIGTILLAGVVLWLVLSIVRRRMAERDPEGGLLRRAQPDRRPALLAAQFGTAAAYWVYDRLFFGPPPALLAPPTVPATAVTTEPTRILAEPIESLHPESVHQEPDAADSADEHAHDEDD
jgi:hypothetical protein